MDPFRLTRGQAGLGLCPSTNPGLCPAHAPVVRRPVGGEMSGDLQHPQEPPAQPAVDVNLSLFEQTQKVPPRIYDPLRVVFVVADWRPRRHERLTRSVDLPGEARHQLCTKLADRLLPQRIDVAVLHAA